MTTFSIKSFFLFFFFKFWCAVQLEGSQKFIIYEAEPVFGIDFTILFREVSIEEAKREEFRRINREVQ